MLKQEIKTNGVELIVVEVPDEYNKFIIKKYSYAGTWLMEVESKELNHWKVNLPRGIHTIISTLRDITESECERLFGMSLSELLSLLQSNGIDASKNLILLTKN